MPKESRIEIVIDENISSRMIDFLQHIGASSLIPLKTLMGKGTPDDKWIPYIAARNAIAMTNDFAMLQDDAIQAAITTSRIRIIFVPDTIAQKNLWYQVTWFMKHYAKIEAYADAMQPGDLAKISIRGKLSQINQTAMQ